MLKQLDNDFFSTSTTVLGEQVGELTDILYGLSAAKSMNASHEFTDYQMSVQYENIYNCLYQRKSNIIDYEIILGKRETLLYDLDEIKGNELAAVLDDFESVKDEIRSLADEVIGNAAAIKADATLESVISDEDLMFSLYMQKQLENMKVDYETFMAMPDEEKFNVVKKLTDMARKYLQDHNINIEPGAKKYAYLAPGLSLYFECSTGMNLALNDYVNVDLGAEAQANFSVLSDEKNSHYFDVSLSDIVGGRYSTPINDYLSAYVEGSLDPVNAIIYIENGISESIPVIQTEADKELAISLEVCCGVEIYTTPIEPFQEEIIEEYTYDELMEMNGLKNDSDHVFDLVTVTVVLWEVVEFFPLLFFL